MNEQKTNSKKHYFFKILMFLILIQPIEIFSAEPIAKGKWKGDALDLPAGIYFYKMISGSFINYKKCILLK